MANSFFRFKKFTVNHDRCAMKVTTDGCLFGAWAGEGIRNLEPACVPLAGRLGIRSFSSAQPVLLDIGCGSGLLSIMVAQKNPLNIDAVEIDKDAAEQAQENVNRSPWGDRIHVIHKDILRFEPDKKYDYIISNPPFYENELEGPHSNRNMAHHSGGLLLSQLFDVIKMSL